MSSLVCQIPGCKTSQGEIEAELQTYLGGYCQVCTGILLQLVMRWCDWWCFKAVFDITIVTFNFARLVRRKERAGCVGVLSLAVSLSKGRCWARYTACWASLCHRV